MEKKDRVQKVHREIILADKDDDLVVEILAEAVRNFRRKEAYSSPTGK